MPGRAPCGNVPRLRTQTMGETTWTKRDKSTGKFMDQKAPANKKLGRASMFSAPRRGRVRGGPRQRSCRVRARCRSDAPTTRTDMNPLDAFTIAARARSVASRSASRSKKSSIAYPEGKYRHSDRFFVASSRGIYYRGRIWRRSCRPQRARSRDCRLNESSINGQHGQLRYLVCISMLERSFSLVMPKLGYLRLRHQFNLF
jgi:hypothetical protein